jgi:hypothetical protein
MSTQLFESPDREIIERIYDEWEGDYRNRAGTGKLDRAFATKDFGMLREALRGVKSLNREFTIVAVRRTPRCSLTMRDIAGR